MQSRSAERLHKVLAKAGIASRRQSERLISEGRVKVNGETVKELGTKVDWLEDKIEVDGRPLGHQEETVYLMLNKPGGFITSLHDPQGRPKVTDLIKDLPYRLYPVGRLDYDTEGLLLLTNDGDLCYRLTHPRFGVEKTYQAKVLGVPPPQKLRTLNRGVALDDGVTAPAKVRIIGQEAGNGILEVTIHEGRKRQVKRMCETVGHPVLNLKRVKFGFLELEGLKPGAYRRLSEEEVEMLRKLAGGKETRTKKIKHEKPPAIKIKRSGRAI